MRLRVFALVIVVGAASACASSPRTEPGGREPTTVTVDNQSFHDMTVYVSRGQRIRLGTAAGKSKTVFTIPPFLVGGAGLLRFIADPIGSSRASVSEEISVSEGDSIGLMIPPN
jgi:hypothetical protein